LLQCTVFILITIRVTYGSKHDLSLSLSCSWDLCCTGLLRSVRWLFTDISGQRICPILTLENGNSKLSQNVSNKPTHSAQQPKKAKFLPEKVLPNC